MLSIQPSAQMSDSVSARRYGRRGHITVSTPGSMICMICMIWICTLCMRICRVCHGVWNAGTVRRAPEVSFSSATERVWGIPVLREPAALLANAFSRAGTPLRACGRPARDRPLELHPIQLPYPLRPSLLRRLTLFEGRPMGISASRFAALARWR